jgi:hypothetical protein
VTSMKRLPYTFFIALCFLPGFSVSASAAEPPNPESHYACSASSFNDNGLASYAESRDQRVGASSTNHIEPGMNGSIRLHGWNQSDVLVRACVYAAARSESDAHALASQIAIVQGPGEIKPRGPEPNDHQHWSVSYEVWAPTSSNFKLEAFNGSIAVQAVTGNVDFHTENGSVRLDQVAGEVNGGTTNGSLAIDVAGNSHNIRASTTNGSIRLNLPENYSAKVEASTVNGRVHCDFDAARISDINGKITSLVLGAGGPVIEARTVNGSIHIGRKTS